MHIVITGASSGIGEALALAFATLPQARLTLVARRGRQLERVASSLPCPTHVIALDLSDPERATECLANATRRHGPIDVLINNAGIHCVGPTAEADEALSERTLAVNLRTPLQLIRAVLPEMTTRGSGTIINIASMAALAPTPGMTWYNASKAGLAAASEALRGELRHSGVEVLTVYPGIIQTEMATTVIKRYDASTLLSLQPQRTADGLAGRVLRAFERREARLVYPAIYGLTRYFPTITRLMMDRLTPPTLGATA